MKRKLTREELKAANNQLEHAKKGVDDLIVMDEYYKLHIKHSAAISDLSFLNMARKHNCVDLKHQEELDIETAYQKYVKDLLKWYNKNRLTKVDETGARYEAERIKIERQAEYWGKTYDEIKDHIDNGVEMKVKDDGKGRKDKRIDKPNL